MKRSRNSRESLERHGRELWELLKAERAEMEGVRAAIESVYARHFPKPLTADLWEMRLGNSPSTTQTILWCQECSREWPCQSWHDCRDIYAATYGHGPEHRPRYLTPHVRKAETSKEASE